MSLEKAVNPVHSTRPDPVMLLPAVLFDWDVVRSSPEDNNCSFLLRNTAPSVASYESFLGYPRA